MSKMVLVSGLKRGEDSKLTAVKKRRTVILAVLLVILFALTVALITQVGYAVWVDGQIVGTVKSGEVVAEIIRGVEEDVTEILGYDYEITNKVELTGTVGSVKGDIAEAFMQTVDEIDMMYVLEIDGQFAACAWSEEEITASVEAVKERYAVADGSTVSFENDVTVTYTYAPIAKAMESGEITELLDPKNGGDAALYVRTIVHETYAEPVPFKTEYVDDDEVYEGSTELKTAGVDGSADITEKVEYVNGSLISRVEVSNIVTLQPVTEVISVGTKFRPAWVSYGEYIWPAEGIVSSEFGPRTVFYGNSVHDGIDIAAMRNTPIVAADGGEVIYSDEYYGYGLMIEIQHDNGEITRYAHCNELVVEVGQKVARGELIAYMGSTGVSSGDHVHFEIKLDGEHIDPLTRLPER